MQPEAGGRPGAQGTPVMVNGQRCTITGDERDDYFAHFARVGTYSDDITSYLAQTIRPGSTCFDVGANIGLTSLYMATLGASVVAFEPSPVAIAHLERNVRANGCAERIRVEPVAVSSAVGETTFMEMPAHLSGSYVAAGGVSHPAAAGLTTFNVPTTTLDHYGEQHDIDSLDLVKIDVEGHELDVLAGARTLLAALRPITIIEFNLWAIVNVQRLEPEAFLDGVFAVFPNVGYLDHGSAEVHPLRDDADRRDFVTGCAERSSVDNLVCDFVAR